MVATVTDATFDAQVLQADRPVLVDFWAPGCSPCQALVPILEEIDATSGGRFLVAKIDVAANPATARRFQMRAVPTLMLFRDGGPVAGRTGVATRDLLVAWIAEGLKRAAP